MNVRATKKRVDSSFLAAGFCALFCLFAAGGPVMGSSSGEEALRTRAEKLYGAIQQGNWTEAEKYVTKESKQIFRSQTKRPVLAYRIGSIKVDPGGEKASVVMQIPVRTPFAAQPLITSQPTYWRLVHGVWYLEFPKPDPHAMDLLFNPPAHPQAPALPPPPPRGPPELKFKSTWAGLGYIHQGEVKVARFPFTNVSQHVVRVVGVQTGGDYLRLKTQQKEFKPGEAGVLEFELDPSVLGWNTEQALSLGVALKTDPGGVYTRLAIGAVFEPTAAPPAAAPSGASRQGP